MSTGDSWCHYCVSLTCCVRDPDSGFLVCTECGTVIEKDIYSSGPTFEKTGDGHARLSGTITRSVQSNYSISREKTLMKGRYEISDMVSGLNIGGGETTINRAHAFYKIAIDKNFTRGRRVSHIAAACLYITCRQTKKAYLLIDFSDYLQINVYILGAAFLQLCKMLNLWEHPIVQKLIDPSLFIHRFTERLLGEKNNAVSQTALRIVASMKRDWMQTGRKPSGLCGAAIYISALSHGLSYSKADIVTVVHVCEATLTKRLIEFENTESGSLTIDEFLSRADELDKETQQNELPTPGQVLCKHKDGNEPHFAHGLCKKCYKKFIKISGGLEGGTEPPAFQRAEKQRLQNIQGEENMEHASLETQSSDPSSGLEKHAKGPEHLTSTSTGVNTKGPVASEDPESTLGTRANDASACQESLGLDDQGDEPETFSDIDDVEVDDYIYNEEEKRYKTVIWEEMNREYLEEQAAKEAAAAAAAKAAEEAFLANYSGAPLSAKELAAATAAAAAKSRKEKRQKRTEEMRNMTPAQTPLEATRQMLKRKAASSKINYDVLEKLFAKGEGEKQKGTEPDKDDTYVDDSMENIENVKSKVDYDGYGLDEFGDSYCGGEDGGGEDAYYDYYGNGGDDYAFEDFEL